MDPDHALMHHTGQPVHRVLISLFIVDDEQATLEQLKTEVEAGSTVPAGGPNDKSLYGKCNPPRTTKETTQADPPQHISV
jgi:hypothetical protein